MATLQTYQSIGNREDLIDTITNISPTKTPFLSSIGTAKATGTLHEYLTDSLATPAVNAKVEGADALYGTLAPRVRLNNYTQNIEATGQISDDQEVVMKAGLKSELSYQMQKAAKELARDTERALIQGSKTVGTASVARMMGGLLYHTSTNKVSVSNQTGADLAGTAQSGTATTIVLAAATGGGVTVNDQILLTGGLGQGQYRTITGIATDTATVAAWDVNPDSTTTYTVFTVPVAVAVADVNEAMRLASTAGGEPDTLHVGGGQKVAIANFGTRRMTAEGTTLAASVDMLESAFGRIAVKFNQWIPDGVIAAVETDKWKAAYLRPTVSEMLARTGTSKKFQITSAVTLEARAENASALVLGCA